MSHYHHHCLFDEEPSSIWCVDIAPSLLIFSGYTGRGTFNLWILNMVDYKTGTPLLIILKAKALLSTVHKRNINV